MSCYHNIPIISFTYFPYILTTYSKRTWKLTIKSILPDFYFNISGDIETQITLDSREGNDIVFGGEGNDFILDLRGDNLLNGDAGNDNIVGGINNDRIRGGTGNDNLVGGFGNDTFIFAPGEGRDFIVDFQLTRDKIGLVEGELSFEDLSFTQEGRNTVLGISSTQEELAVLRGIDADDLNNRDLFVTVSDISSIDDIWS